MAKHIRRAESERKDNSVGNTINGKIRGEAITHLPTAKLMESNRTAKGWRYITNGKTSKQVHPDRLAGYLSEKDEFGAAVWKLSIH